MARLVAEAESRGGIAELKSRKDLFATTPEGAGPDPSQAILASTLWR